MDPTVTVPTRAAIPGTVGEALEEWRNSRLGVADTTAASHWYVLRWCRTRPGVRGIDTIPVDEIRPTHIRQLLADLLAHGRNDGGGLALSSVTTILNVLSGAFKELHAQELIPVNPTLGVKPPQLSGFVDEDDEEAHEVWTADQVAKFLRWARSNRLAVLWYLAIYLGLRRGELAGLRWSDVDFDHGVIRCRLNRTLRSSIPGQPGGTTDHNLKSRRGANKTRPKVLVLNGTLLEELRWLRERQPRAVHVLTDRHGEPYHPQRLSRIHKRACESAGVPVCSLHTMRQVCAVLFRQAGVPEAVAQEVLGHASVAMTRHYSRGISDTALAQVQAPALAALERLVGAAGG